MKLEEVTMKWHLSLKSLCVLCVLAVSLFLSCSQNESHPSGPAPEAPTATREARIVQKEGEGMNQVAAPKAPEGVVYEGVVELAQGLEVPAGAAIFVMAQDPNRPGAPVAAIKLPATHFPLPFRLTDENAMGSEPLPDHLELLAKLSASGMLGGSDPRDLETKPVHGHPGEAVRLVLEKR